MQGARGAGLGRLVMPCVWCPRVGANGLACEGAGVVERSGAECCGRKGHGCTAAGVATGQQGCGPAVSLVGLLN